MGEVIRKSKSGRFIGWYVRYVDSDGKRKTRATKAATAAEARRILIELEAQAGRRSLGVPERPVTINGPELIARWLEEYQPRARNYARWRTDATYELRPVLPLIQGRVTPADAQRCVRQLCDRYKASTVRKRIALLCTAWNWAVRSGLAERNPWTGLRLPKAESRVEYLSRDEIRGLLDAADADPELRGPVYAIAIRLCLYAGLRCCEAFGLRWRNIDLDRGVITVRSGYRDAPTKNGRERVIPIAEQLKQALLTWRARCPFTPSGHVCPALNAGQWQSTRRRPAINRLYLAAGLCVPQAPWHVLRHTFASHFVMSGGNLLSLQRLLGHTTMKMTAVYSHLCDDHIAAEVKKLIF